MTTARRSNTQIPLPIKLLGGLLVFIGAAAGLAQYLAPSSAFAGLPEVTPAIQNVAWQVASRSLGQAALLILAFWLRDYRVLGAAFVMRAITETQDLVITLYTGSAPGPAVAVAIVFVVVFIIPELLSARWLFRAAAQHGTGEAARAR
jgi:hypothetical protein